MFEAIVNQLKQQAVDALTGQHHMAQPDAERAADAAGKSLAELVKQQIAQNDFSALNEALSGAPTDAHHQAVQNLSTPLAARIAERTGMETSKAQNVASTLLPLAFNLFNEQVQQAQSQGIDVKKLVTQLASGGLNMANMGAAMTLAKNFMKGQDKSNAPGGMFSKFF